MAAQNPPVNGVAYIVYIALQDMANPGAYKANPTLASGDVKVSIDGGAFANIDAGGGTLPAVTPAGGIAVKVTLNATQMTGDNIFVQFIDQTSPKEWADYSFCIQTVAGAWNVGKTGYSLSAAGIQAIWDALTSALTTVGSIGKRLADDIDATISSRSTYAGGAVASVTGNVGGNVAGSVGSVTAPVTVGTNNDKTGYELSGTGNDAAADALLVRDLTGVAAPATRSPFNALRKLMNRVGLAGGTLTIYQEDDATPAYTQTVTQDASQTPIKSLDTN